MQRTEPKSTREDLNELLPDLGGVLLLLLALATGGVAAGGGLGGFFLRGGRPGPFFFSRTSVFTLTSSLSSSPSESSEKESAELPDMTVESIQRFRG